MDRGLSYESVCPRQEILLTKGIVIIQPAFLVNMEIITRLFLWLN